MVYEGFKIHGPYKCKDGRLRVILVEVLSKKQKTVSYPKYIMECYLDRYLTDDETIDHIDGNPLNNDLTNLRVLNRKEHCSNDAVRNKDVLVKCRYCGKEFLIKGNSINNRNRKDRHQSGYFCSKECSGKYGADVQNGRTIPEKTERIIPEKFRLHKSAEEETL